MFKTFTAFERESPEFVLFDPTFEATYYNQGPLVSNHFLKMPKVLSQISIGGTFHKWPPLMSDLSKRALFSMFICFEPSVGKHHTDNLIYLLQVKTENYFNKCL